jgi:hypothetical protein
VHNATATSFPLFKHTGGSDTAPAFSGLHVCLQLTWEVGLPPSPVEFSSLHYSHKLSRSWLLGEYLCSHPLQPGLACLFTVLGGIPLPLSLVLRAPHPLCYVSLLFLLLITQFLFYPWVGVGLSRGAMLLWPRVVCGSTAYCLAHLVVCVFPSHMGKGIWRPGGPPGFSV